MPGQNRFRHQTYSSAAPPAPYEQLLVELPPPVQSAEYQQQMQQAGDALRRANVACVYLVHGTFAGDDVTGVLVELERLVPSMARALRRLQKQLIDSLAGTSGNYTPEFAQTFQRTINGDGLRPIPVTLFPWSSQNYHVARAHAAVRLIDHLSSVDFQPEQRVLLWGHSHAGNVFALATNLLAADAQSRWRFFHAARSYFRWPGTRRYDLPVWRRVHKLLEAQGNPLSHVALDLVTFGTPIRYGWDSAGYQKLLHFVHHRPLPDVPVYQAAFPPQIDQVLAAWAGDYVQQMAIAGTNTLPYIFSWRTWLAELRMNRFLQPGLRRRDLLRRLKMGACVPDEGMTLLVQYQDDDRHLVRQLAGHAIYTRPEWLPLHAEQVARHFYIRDQTK